MFRHLSLSRPLAVIDLETTGTDPKADRVVEISVCRIEPDGTHQTRTRRLNPGIPIPPGATAVHGITDADVADQPSFKQVAAGLTRFLHGCDLCGFNLKRFDLKLLTHEFYRAGHSFDATRRSVVDVMELFHQRERRDLTAAVRFYLGRDHAGAHSAEADVAATAAILDAMAARYPDLPRTVADLAAATRRENAVDVEGRFVMTDTGPAFAFGKHRGRTVREVAAVAPGYLEWCLGGDFADDAKSVVRAGLAEAARTRLPTA